MFVLVLLHFVTAVTINLCQYCKNNVIRILLSLLSDSASRMMASLVSPVKQVYLVADRRPLCPIHCAEQLLLLLLFIYYTRRQHISNRLQIQKNEIHCTHSQHLNNKKYNQVNQAVTGKALWRQLYLSYDNRHCIRRSPTHRRVRPFGAEATVTRTHSDSANLRHGRAFTMHLLLIIVQWCITRANQHLRILYVLKPYFITTTVEKFWIQICDVSPQNLGVMGKS